MKKLPYSVIAVLPLLALAGCASGIGGMAADAGLAGAGGVVGYKVSGGRIGGAAIGAATGYVASKIAQSSYTKAAAEAEKTGYDRAMNQAVKQEYWIIQNQQKSLPAEAERSPRLTPIVIPESNINGVIQKAHVEYIRLDR